MGKTSTTRSQTSFIRNSADHKSRSSLRTASPKVVYEGDDVTPLALSLHREKSVSVSEKSRSESVMSLSLLDYKMFNTARFYNDLYNATLQAESALQKMQIAGLVDEFSIAPMFPSQDLDVVEEEEREEVRPSAFSILTQVSAVPDEEEPIVKLTLVETNTFIYFELPSITVDKDSEEAVQIEASNKNYEYLTIGKGRNRKVTNVEVQTYPLLQKSRATEAALPETQTCGTFVSNWVMYDTYHDVQEEKSIDNEENEMIRLIRNPRFLEAICVVERLLANNVFNEPQKRYKGLSDPEPFRGEIDYNYRLNLLWIFKNNDTAGRAVSAIAFNAANEDIIAVGYGKFYFTDKSTGIVMIWNLKNPVQPERKYSFSSPITSASFSKQNPNFLAIGLFNGSVKVLDITSRTTQIVAESASPSFEPVWQLTWHKGQDYHKGKEIIIGTCQDGRVNSYIIVGKLELDCSQIMRIARPQGQLQGIETLQRNKIPGIPVCKYAAALVFQQDPQDPTVYYIGTNEGTVHTCSKTYYQQHLDVFLAHDGPIYAIKFSPFSSDIFLTCGDDWTIRIWARGIIEPLLELVKTLQSIQDADWSPTHSTVIASICGLEIFIWDLQRKAYFPQSVTTSPSNYRNTIVKFTPSGRCLLVGDIEGNVHVFSLEDMPFRPFFQSNLLMQSIIRNLITREDLVRTLNKAGRKLIQ